VTRLWQTPNVVDQPLPLVLQRPFFVNSLVATHRQLLLRSPMGDVYEDRIDVLFKAVSAVRLSFDLDSLEIRQPTPEETSQIEAECGEALLRQHGRRAYMIGGGPVVGYVIALSAWMARDTQHGANPSQLLFDVEGTTPPERIYRIGPNEADDMAGE
jgi:hypothetical protein